MTACRLCQANPSDLVIGSKEAKNSATTALFSFTVTETKTLISRVQQTTAAKNGKMLAVDNIHFNIAKSNRSTNNTCHIDTSVT